jgi:hypothetical protein
MATTLGTWLQAGTALPMAIENKFSMLPKLSSGLNKVATMIPAGPSILPNPPASGLPVFGVGNIPTPPALPNIFKGPTTTGSALKLAITPMLPARDTTGEVNFLQRHPQKQVGGTTFNFK